MDFTILLIVGIAGLVIGYYLLKAIATAIMELASRLLTVAFIGIIILVFKLLLFK